MAVKFSLILVSLILICAGFWGYEQYQIQQQDKSMKVEQLIQEQNKIIQEQRAAQGRLPEKVVYVPEEKQPRTLPEPRPQLQPAVSEQMSNLYQCDGRTHCSQMRSYEEAVWFIRNCPNTKMDGDGDGIPCERQFGR